LKQQTEQKDKIEGALMTSSIFFKGKHCFYKPGSVPALLPVPAIYLLRTSPCASSVLPSIAALRHLGGQPSLSMVYMNLQPPAETARRSPVGWWSLTPPSHPYLTDEK